MFYKIFARRVSDATCAVCDDNYLWITYIIVT